MFIQYIKYASRTLLKNKYYTFINVIGLVCGMLPAMIIAKYLSSSLQFDSFHKNKGRIYSVTHDEFVNGSHQPGGSSTYSGVAEVAAQFSEASKITKYSMHVRSTVTSADQGEQRVSFVEKRIFVADSNFLKVFTFQLLKGDEEKALSRANSVVLTNSSAKKYFGDSNPIGRSLAITVPWGMEKSYIVTGVVGDVPKPSQFMFEFLVTNYEFAEADLWKTPSCALFLLLEDNVSAAAFQAKMNTRMSDNPELTSAGRNVKLTLTKLGDKPWSNSEYLLAALGIFILLACWMNYVNQTIAQTYSRVKEVGVLRVMGATRQDLQGQFIVESTITCVIAFVIIVFGYLAVQSTLQSFTGGRPLGLRDFPLTNFGLVAVFVAGIVITAGIPTTILFSQNFATTLRSAHSTKIGGVTVRKILVVLQFAISTILMISIFVISGQLDYVLNKEKGFETDDILVVEAPMITDTTWHAKRRALRLLKARYEELPFVMGVASSTTVPGEEYRQETFLSWSGQSAKALIHQCGVDENFFSVYEMEFIAGQDLIPNANAQNATGIILNESAAWALGITDFEAAINTKIVDHDEPGSEFDLAGIVKDFHQTALRYQMKPMAFRYQQFRGHISLKTNGTSLGNYGLDKGLESVKELYTEIYPLASFETYFLNDKFVTEYSEEQYYRRLFAYFTVVSIVISCLGLFGLSLLVSTKRQKEIGIRKTFGASSFSILGIFLRGYLGQLSIAVLIGCPVAYVLMNMWLRNYAYRIHIGIELMSIAVLWLVVIFFFTIAYHTIRSSISNPVKILRD